MKWVVRSRDCFLLEARHVRAQRGSARRSDIPPAGIAPALQNKIRVLMIVDLLFAVFLLLFFCCLTNDGKTAIIKKCNRRIRLDNGSD